jgi:suppressor of G2 allele of SKP1
MSSQAALGQKALDASDYPTAITHFTAALREFPTSPDYYIKRSIAHQRSGQFKLSLNDSEIAVVAATKRAKRELIQQAQFRRAISLLSLERYGDAKFLIDMLEEMGMKDNSLGIYKAKVEGKLKALEEGDEKAKVEVKKIPEVEIPAPEKTETKKPEKKIEAATPAPTGVTTIPSRIKHDWYQTTDRVTVTLMAKNAPIDKTVVDIQAQSVSVSFPLASGSTFEFSLEPLFDTINPEACTFSIKPSNIELVLIKSVSKKWASLEGQSSKPKPSTSIPDAVLNPVSSTSTTQPIPSKVESPSYPTSSRSGPKNWDKVVATMDEADLKEDGDEVSNFFQHLYKGADADTQRAMMKSYQESNGTVLSTNWSEVGAKKVEVAPPDGMQEKRWDGKGDGP